MRPMLRRWANRSRSNRMCRSKVCSLEAGMREIAGTVQNRNTDFRFTCSLRPQAVQAGNLCDIQELARTYHRWTPESIDNQISPSC